MLNKRAALKKLLPENREVAGSAVGNGNLFISLSCSLLFSRLIFSFKVSVDENMETELIFYIS